VCAVVFFFDGLVLGQGGFAMCFGFVGVILGLVELVRGAFGDRSRMLTGIFTFCMYTALPFAVIGYVVWQKHIAHDRTLVLADALDHYKADHGDYPESLDALVPTYAPHVPRARYTVLFGGFDYSHGSGEATIMYVALPPFLRNFYDVGAKKWSTLD
jgi:hypothetical protein